MVGFIVKNLGSMKGFKYLSQIEILYTLVNLILCDFVVQVKPC